MKPKTNKLYLICSEHGPQEFVAMYTHCGILLACGCGWSSCDKGLKFDGTSKAKDNWILDAWKKANKKKL